jgi:predicted nucleic acid-binding protein
MRYALDPNIALKWVLPEADDLKAIKVRDEFGQGVHDPLAPDIFPIEVAHALARAERRGQIPLGEGAQKMADVFAFMPTLHPYLPLLPRAFAVASQARIGVYDCLYVILAEQEQCECLTADDRLARTLQSTFPFIRLLASF